MACQPSCRTCSPPEKDFQSNFWPLPPHQRFQAPPSEHGCHQARRSMASRMRTDSLPGRTRYDSLLLDGCCCGGGGGVWKSGQGGQTALRAGTVTAPPSRPTRRGRRKRPLVVGRGVLCWKGWLPTFCLC